MLTYIIIGFNILFNYPGECCIAIYRADLIWDIIISKQSDECPGSTDGVDISRDE